MWSSLAQRCWGERLLLLLVCAFPFVSVAVPGGGSAVYGLLALAALWLGWGGIAAGGRELRRWYLLLFLLFLLGAVSLFYTSEMQNGVERLERLLRIATLPLLVGLLLRFRVTADRLLVAGLAIAAAAMAVQGYYQALWLGRGYAGGLYHKIIFGDMAMLFALLLFAAVVTLLQGRSRWLAGVAILLALYASVLSATRGAWLVVPVAAVVMVWLYRRRVSSRVWLALSALAVLLIALLAVLQPAPLVAPIERGIYELRLFLTDPTQATSWGARLIMWWNALLIWWDHPLLGTGLGDFNHDMQLLVAQGRSLSADILQYGHAHSIYFDTLATLGLVGLLLMAAALFIVPGIFFYRAWLTAGSASHRFAALSGLLTVIAFAVFGFSEGWLSRNPFVTPYALFLALFAATLKGEGQPREGRV